MIDKQFEFAVDFARLILFAERMAEEAARAGDRVQITLGDTFEDQDPKLRPMEAWLHEIGSLHSMRLAGDLNLFVNGEWITKNHIYWQKLGAFWKGLRTENAWGGDFAGKNAGDFGHFSRQHGNKK